MKYLEMMAGKPNELICAAGNFEALYLRKASKGHVFTNFTAINGVLKGCINGNRVTISEVIPCKELASKPHQAISSLVPKVRPPRSPVESSKISAKTIQTGLLMQGGSAEAWSLCQNARL